MSLRWLFSRSLASSLALVFASCGEDEQRRGVTDPHDLSFGEVSFDVEIDVSQGLELPPDFGEPCLTNSDCESHQCVEGPAGFVCSVACLDADCPAGWGCRGIQTAGDIAFVCVPNGPGPDVVDDTSTSDVDVTDTTGSDTTGPEDTADTTGPQPDTTQPPTGNACDAPPGVGSDNLLAESQVSRNDWPDCITGDCFSVNPGVWVLDLRSSAFTGAMGTFDGGTHTYEFGANTGPGPDIDIVAIKAPPRTMLELAALRSAPSGLADPLIYVHDGFGVRTYNADVSDSNACARTTIGFPYVSDLPIYAVIEDSENYDRWSPTGYAAGTVGGPEYGWILRVRATPWVPTELGTLRTNQVVDLSNDALMVGGETRYYRFYAPGTARPRVTLTRTGGAGFQPSLGGIKTIAGELVWQKVEHDGDNNGVVVLQSSGMRPCVPQNECPSGLSCPDPMCSGADVEWVFAVFDYNGAAAPGGSRFDLRVEVAP